MLDARGIHARLLRDRDRSDSRGARAPGPRGRPRPPRLLPSAVHALHDAAADRAGAEREGARRQPRRAGARDLPARGARRPVPDCADVRVADGGAPASLESPGSDARLVVLPRARPGRVSSPSATGATPCCASTCGRCGSSTRKSSSRSGPRGRTRRSPSCTGAAVSAPTPRSRLAVSCIVGLGVLKSLEPDRRIRRVLIVGPGLDLAPRTSLQEAGPPQSYQPWAVIDALVGLGLSSVADLEVVGADINPRVVNHLRRSRSDPPTLTLVSGIREQRDGQVIGGVPRLLRATRSRPRPDGCAPGAGRGRRTSAQDSEGAGARGTGALAPKRWTSSPNASTRAPFDLVVATNILPYFNDVELVLAMTNIAAMLAPGGIFLHNEARPLLGDITDGAWPAIRAIAPRDDRHRHRRAAAGRQRLAAQESR